MAKKEPLYPHMPKGRNKEVSQVKVIETGDRDWFKPGIHLRNPSAQKIEDAKEDAINKGFDTVYVHRVAEAKEATKGHSSPSVRTDLIRKWYDKGAEAGKKDGWMDVENTIKETAEKHPEIKGLTELVYTDIDYWEETDHFNILYGSKMIADAKGDIDLYSDLKSEFWEGYLAGRKDIGIDIYKIAKEVTNA